MLLGSAEMILKVYRARKASLVSVHESRAELRDLLSRFPAAADPRKAGECGA